MTQAQIVTVTLIQYPAPPTFVLAMTDRTQIVAKVRLSSNLLPGVGKIWLTEGQLLTDIPGAGKFALFLPDDSKSNRDAIAAFNRMATTKIPFLVSGVGAVSGGGAWGTGAGMGSTGAGPGAGQGKGQATGKIPEIVGVEPRTIDELSAQHPAWKNRGSSLKHALLGSGLSEDQRQALLGMTIEELSTHEPSYEQLGQADFDKLIKFVKNNLQRLKDLPTTATAFQQKVRIDELTRTLQSIGATKARAPDPNDLGPSARGSLQPWERQLLQEFKAQYGTPAAWGEPASGQRLTAEHKFRLAFQLAVKKLPAGVGQELVAMISNQWFWVSIMGGITVYFVLWANPDPTITKSIAAAITIALLLVSTATDIYNTAKAWMALEEDAKDATSLADLEAAADNFAKALGAVGARLLVTLATILAGGKVIPKNTPPAPPAVLVGGVMGGGAGAATGVVVNPAYVGWVVQVLADGTVIIIHVGTGGTMVAMAAKKPGRTAAQPPPEYPRGAFTTSPPDFMPDWLELHEGVGTKRGHTLAKHVLKVGQTALKFLQERLAAESKLDSASCYLDQRAAETFTQQAIEANQSEIIKWLRSPWSPETEYRELPALAVGKDTGYILRRGATTTVMGQKIKVVLIRFLPKGLEPRYIVLTSHPQ